MFCMGYHAKKRFQKEKLVYHVSLEHLHELYAANKTSKFYSVCW